MKMKIIITMGLIFGCSALAKPTANDGVIDSVYSIQSLLNESRLQYLPVSPPTFAPYIDVRENVLAVDWRSFKNKAFTRQMYAEMDSNGFPIYRVRVQQEFSGEIVFSNAFGIEVLRLPAPKRFNVYAWAENHFKLPASDFSEMQLDLYPASKIQLEIFLLPQVFLPAYLEIQAKQAAQEAEVMPMMMSVAASTGDEVLLPLPVDVVPGSNGTVEIWVDTTGTAVRHVEIFSRMNLVYPPGWALVANDLPASGSVPSVWSDISTNTMFYYVNDADNDMDGDGYSDLREHLYSLTETDIFNFFDKDSDGLQDWFEIRFWGSIALYDATDDPDGDGLVNGDEMEYLITPSLTNVVFYSDPSLFDSDFEGLNDFEERRVWNTDAMNSDSDFDGLSDAIEVLGSPATDPNNPDIDSPTVVFSKR